MSIESNMVEATTKAPILPNECYVKALQVKHIVCLSGGDGSALTAKNVAWRFGKENLILLNHDINSKKEDADIKRFKQDVSDSIGVPITYANYNDIQNPDEIPNQFDICIKAGAMTSPNGNALCTALLKTEPFYRWLSINFPRGNTLFETEKPCIIYYGFGRTELVRIQRRSGLLGAMGYKTDYPSLWDVKPYKRIGQLKIKRARTYKKFKHANCVGCLKASILHWYVTYWHDRVAYFEGVVMEIEVDFTVHTIIRNGVKIAISLKELIPFFEQMKIDGIPTTEHQSAHKFANLLRKYQIEELNANKPCECTD